MKNPLPKNDRINKKYFLTILNLKSAANSINPNSLIYYIIKYMRNSGEHAKKNLSAASCLIEKIITPAIPNAMRVRLNIKKIIRSNCIHNSHK